MRSVEGRRPQYVLRFDHWLVGLAGVSNLWLAVVPGFVSNLVWEWANRRR